MIFCFPVVATILTGQYERLRQESQFNTRRS